MQSKPFAGKVGRVYNGFVLGSADVKGFHLTATIETDLDSEAPWEWCDGHGPVSDWERRDAKPWELVVASDHHAKRFYDYSAAVRLALSDSRGVEGGRRENETPREYAKRAALADYEAMRAFASGEWGYFGVIVEVSKAGFGLGSASLWGIDGNHPNGDNYYFLDVANDLVDEAIGEAEKQARVLCKELCES